MPRRNNDVETVGDAMRDNVMGSLRHYRFFLGYSRERARRALRRMYPNASDRVIEDILDRYTASMRVSNNVNRAGSEYKPVRTEIPCNRYIDTPYRYVVNMIYTDNRTGVPTRHMTIVNSQSQLSKGEIQEIGADQTKSAYANKSRRDTSPPGKLPVDATVSMDVVSIERRC